LSGASSYRNPPVVAGLLDRVRRLAVGRAPLRFMEFCGGHTHAIAEYGLRSLLPDNVRLSSGPGCPVCVTASGEVDAAIALAARPGVTVATFGDMMRVPGTAGSLSDARASGADVRVVYSPRDALEIARACPAAEVVFLGVGFETTAPVVAAAVLEAEASGVSNFSVLSLHKLTPPAMRAVLDAGEVRLDGIIGPGHVSAVLGSEAWGFLPRDYRLGCAVAGFEPTDVVSAVVALVEMVAGEEPAVVNAYGRAVTAAGNRVALQMLEQVFAPADREWRGLGFVPNSGLQLRPEYADWDAGLRFDIRPSSAPEPPGCRCGEVLRGVIEPRQCPLFGRACSPASPVGPCMVSSEGACAAHYSEAEEQ